MKAFVPALAGLALVAGCARDPLAVDCPAVPTGDLVVTEVRGPQSGDDTYGEWIEIHNAGSAPADIAGLEVAITRLDGSSENVFFVRDHVVVEAGDYVVLGRQPASARGSHVDYGYAADLDSDLYGTAAVTLSACGEQIDQIVYRNLPRKGTYALDGATEPRADANDMERNWCVDDTVVDDDDSDGTVGVVGTPGERNTPCS